MANRALLQGAEVDAGDGPVSVPEVRAGGDLGAVGAGQLPLPGMGACPAVAEADADGQAAGLVAGAADLRGGRRRPPNGGAKGTGSAGGCPGDARGSKTPGQAPEPLASQGVPCGDMIIMSLKMRNFKTDGRGSVGALTSAGHR